MSIDKTTDLDIAIVGGGIAGLCLAVGLLNKGLNVIIYESIRNYREIGAGIAFGPNALKAMALIDPRIRDVVSSLGRGESKDGIVFHCRQGMTMRNWKAMDHIEYSKCKEPLFGATRAAFLEKMLNLIPAGVIRYSKRLVFLEETSTGTTRINFKDGASAEHDVVIGCDGIHSVVRKHVLGVDNPDTYPRFSGKVCHRGIVDMQTAVRILGEAPANVGTVYCGQSGHIVTFPVANGAKMNVGGFASRSSWESDDWVRKTSREEMKADYPGWGEKLVELLGHVENTDMWAVFDLPRGDTFFKGNVAILGDAAHASSPFQGSGSSMAIEDAYVLSNLMEKVRRPEDVQSAMKAYDAVRRPRSQKLVETSMESCRMLEYENPHFGTDMDLIKANIRTRWNWIWYEDLEGELEQALVIMREAS